MDALSPVTEVIADITEIRAAEADDRAGLLAAAKQAWADVEAQLETRFLAGGSAFEAMEARATAQDVINHVVGVAFDIDGQLQQLLAAEGLPHQRIGADQARHDRGGAAAQPPGRRHR